MRAGWMPLREAWEEALYGEQGFYLKASPHTHFRTSVHASPLFAGAILQLARRLGLSTIVDLGAGSGELLGQIHRLEPRMTLVGVDLRRRPEELPSAVEWYDRLPDSFDGLLLANELLDNVPCDVVERDSDGSIRVVEVQPDSGDQRLGPLAPDDVVTWTRRWWPLSDDGDRAEVGLERDRHWQRSVETVRSGAALAVDFGHLADYRPTGSTLASYRNGRQHRPALDGHHDVAAHVAVDSVAAAVGGTLSRQHDMLRDLGVSATRPSPRLAETDPIGYVQFLTRSSEAAELMCSPGLGDFHWVLTRR